VLVTSTGLIGEEKMGELACRLARESIFGEELVAKCTVQGLRGNALPLEGLFSSRMQLSSTASQ
jgi:hypothetical protein